MPEMSSWPTQNSGPTGTVDSREAATHIGALVYPHTSTLKVKSGFRPGPGASPGVVTATGTPDGFVHVAPFQLLMQNIRGSGLGCYIACLDATKDINILATPADPTNPRDDLIVAQQSDIFDSDANSDFLVRHVVGTPAPTPSDPAISGSTNVVALARVRVNANATSINGGNITDLRTSGHAKSLTGGLYTTALGGILPVGSAAERNALTGLHEGLAVWRSDIDAINIYDGSGWHYFTRPTGADIATQQATGSTSYTDLTTVGPAVTVETGTAAMVTVSAFVFNNTAGAVSYMAYALSGATTLAASDDRALVLHSETANGQGRMSMTHLQTGLTPGSNTFTAKYKVNSGSGTFGNRSIIVQPC